MLNKLSLKYLRYAILMSLLLVVSGRQAYATDPFVSPTKTHYFTMLKGTNGQVAVGARMDVVLYPKGTTLQFVAKKLQPIPPAKRYQYPEWLIVQELKYCKQGNLHKLLKLYKSGPSQKTARSRYSDMAYTKKSSQKVEKETLIYKARYGPLVGIMTETKTPEYKFQFPMPYSLEQSKDGNWLFDATSKGGDLFGILLNDYPYWHPSYIGAFKPTKDYFPIVEQYSKKYPKPDVAVYVRKIHVFDPALVKVVRHILHVYQTGSDKDIIAIWRPKERKETAKQLADVPSIASQVREPFTNKRGFRAFPSIIGKDVAFILLKPIGGGQIVNLQLVKRDGVWYQASYSDEGGMVFWLPTYPAYQSYVLSHRGVSVLIQSAGQNDSAVD